MQMIVEIKSSKEFKKNLSGYPSFPGYTIWSKQSFIALKP